MFWSRMFWFHGYLFNSHKTAMSVQLIKNIKYAIKVEEADGSCRLFDFDFDA